MKNASLFTLFFSLLFPLGLQAQNTLRLNAGQSLKQGQKIEVAGKGYLILQNDGNLVAYDAANTPKWATGTYGKVATHVIMQADGNLVIYNNTIAVWASNTSNMGTNGGYFEINPDTWSACIFKQNGTVGKVLPSGKGTDSITDGTLVSSPGNDTMKIKVIGLEYFRDREVTFFCQAGYVSRFELSYNLKGQNKTFSSNYLPVGQLQSFKVPYDATNIVAKGFMISAGEHPIFNEKLSAPADVCYKTYGTIFDRRWSKCN